MKAFHTYLIFDGNAREAMTFYQQCTGGELSIQTFAEAKMDAPPGSENSVIHARLQKGPAILMASDSMAGEPFTQGNNFFVSIDCESIEETKKLFTAFSENGKIIMEPQDTFWEAYFGMLTDKFGIGWMFNCERGNKG
ncbi:MAG: VOC family protein [Anaerolineae bacterium]|nr:VOC family protein [Gemmatimonadaceae bacterium]